MEYAVETNGLVKVYPGGVRALDGVDLRVPEGVVFGLFGHNGAGKTTLLSILIGLVRPTRGTVRVLGIDAVKNSIEVRKRTSVMPEGFGFYEDMSGLSNLVFLAMLDGFDKREAERKATEVIEKVGLSQVAKRKVSEYSRGMKQRLCLAQALLKEADLYLLDEPTAGLDPEGAKMFRELVLELAKEGKTVIISTHLLQEVGSVCSHAAIIRRGKILAQGSFEEIASEIGKSRGYEYEVHVRGDPEALASVLKDADWVVSTSIDKYASKVRVLVNRKADEEIIRLARDAGLEVLSIKLLPADWSEVFDMLHREGV